MTKTEYLEQYAQEMSNPEIWGLESVINKALPGGFTSHGYNTHTTSEGRKYGGIRSEFKCPLGGFSVVREVFLTNAEMVCFESWDEDENITLYTCHFAELVSLNAHDIPFKVYR